MYTVTIETEFSAAHIIRGYDGPCAHPHGHNWKVTVEASTDVLDQLGMSVDFYVLEKKMNEIADLEVQMHMIKVNSWFEINKLLTPEQQKTWKKALEYASEMQHGEMGMDHRSGHSMPPHHEEPMPKK